MFIYKVVSQNEVNAFAFADGDGNTQKLYHIAGKWPKTSRIFIQ